MADHTCQKCAGTMEAGVIPDMGYGRVWVSSWIKDADKGPLGGLKMWRKPRFEITSYRCVKCGYLECYAKP